MPRPRLRTLGSLVIASALLGVVTGCSSQPAVREQAYARLGETRTFEYEMPVVWKAIDEAFRNFKVLERQPDRVGVNEWAEVRKRSLLTDWIYGQSRDKYIEYQVNGSPRRKLLQTRYRLRVDTQSVIGGTQVRVESEEQVERLDAMGKPAGYENVDQADPTRSREWLEKVQMALLGASP